MESPVITVTAAAPGTGTFWESRLHTAQSLEATATRADWHRRLSPGTVADGASA